MEYITFFEFNNPNPKIQGGKGTNLIKLHKFGFNIPKGFIVDRKAFNQFFNENNLNGTLSAFNNLTPKEILTFSKKVSSSILESPIPKDVVRDIKNSLNHLEFKGNESYYAVRSSATVEDSERFSYAGQASSYLFNNDINEILESIVKCWASLFSPQSLLYLLKMRESGLNIPLQDLGMAVVIQKMVPSKISGILFTVDVLNNNEHQVLINSTWGLCEVVANNICQPDRIIVNKNNFKIKEYTIGKKERQCIMDPNNKGTKVVDTPLDLKNKPSLTHKQVKKLINVALQIEEKFRKPQDIEWTIDIKNNLYILQSRPITTFKK
jgi:pyruvate,water dikinase